MATRTGSDGGVRTHGAERGDGGARPGEAELADTFRTLVGLMYDTEVPLSTLDERVVPFLAPDVSFTDPWLTARGLNRIRAGMRGFHCAFRFDLVVSQLDVLLDEGGEGGRVLVDGVMRLRSIPRYEYPLRTFLVLEFVLTGGRPLVTHLDEMWSFGHMIRHAPLGVGLFYDRVFRPAAGWFFEGFFRLACAVRGGPPEPGREPR